MDSTVTIEQLQTATPHFIRQAQKQGSVTIAQDGRAVAFLISKDRMEAIIESMEIMGNPQAMKAIGDYEKGLIDFKDVSCLEE